LTANGAHVGESILLKFKLVQLEKSAQLAVFRSHSLYFRSIFDQLDFCQKYPLKNFLKIKKIA